MQCLLKGINTYRILNKLDTFASATVYLECERNKEANRKIDDVKEISYYVFQKITHMWRRCGTPQNFVLTFIDEFEKQIIIKKTVEVAQ